LEADRECAYLLFPLQAYTEHSICPEFIKAQRLKNSFFYIYHKIYISLIIQQLLETEIKSNFGKMNSELSIIAYKVTRLKS